MYIHIFRIYPYNNNQLSYSVIIASCSRVEESNRAAAADKDQIRIRVVSQEQSSIATTESWIKEFGVTMESESDEEGLTLRIRTNTKRLREFNEHLNLNESISDDDSSTSSSSSSSSTTSSSSEDDAKAEAVVDAVSKAKSKAKEGAKATMLAAKGQAKEEAKAAKQQAKAKAVVVQADMDMDVDTNVDMDAEIQEIVMNTNISSGDRSRFRELCIPLRTQHDEEAAVAAAAMRIKPTFMPTLRPSGAKNIDPSSLLAATSPKLQSGTTGTDTVSVAATCPSSISDRRYISSAATSDEQYGENQERMEWNKWKKFKNSKPGDWICKCGQYVFAKKSVCFKCGTPKPAWVLPPSLPLNPHVNSSTYSSSCSNTVISNSVHDSANGSKRARSNSLGSCNSVPMKIMPVSSGSGGANSNREQPTKQQPRNKRSDSEEVSRHRDARYDLMVEKDNSSNKGICKDGGDGNGNKTRTSRSNSWDSNFVYVSRASNILNTRISNGVSSSGYSNSRASGGGYVSTITNAKDQESILQWKNRLWPTSALLDFCRAITHCKISRDRIPHQQLHLIPWWGTLQKTGTSFEGPQSYISKFFLAICEECRVTLDSSVDDISTPYSSFSSKVNDGNERSTTDTTGMTKQFDVIEIVRNSKVSDQHAFVSKLQGFNIREGSIMILRVVADDPSSSHVHNDNKKGNKDNDYDNHGGSSSSSSSGSMFWGGDIVVLQSGRWKKSCIGLVQCWDPDSDVALGVMARAAGIPVQHQMDHPSSLGIGNINSVDGREVVNILICVSENFSDTSASASASLPQDGWLNTYDMVQNGDKVVVTSIGNAMTSIRECQALASIDSMSRTFQRLIYNPTEIIEEYQSKRPASTMISSSFSSSTSSSSSSLPSSFVAPPMCVPLPLWNVLTKNFNASQLRAIKSACPRGDLGDDSVSQAESSQSLVLPVTLLQGPPGTGKTKVILGLVSVFLAGALEKRKSGTRINAGASLLGARQQFQKQPQTNTTAERKKSSIRILICAPSNTAIDEVVYRLKTQGYYDEFGQKREGKDLNLVRIGNGGAGKSSSIFNSFSSSTHHFRKEQGNQAWSPSKPTIDDNRDSVSQEVEQASLDFLADSRRQVDISRKNKVHNIMEYRKDVLEDAEVVCSTLSGAGSQPLLELAMRIPNFRFDVIIIDEAAQAVEPSALIPLKYNPQVVVMVGDPQQLPATVFSPMAKNANYSQSLFLRLHRAGFPMTMLETQYRMHPRIAEFPSKHFYDGMLKTSNTVNNYSHSTEFHSHQSGMFGPFVFHDVSYGKQRVHNGRISNSDEVHYIVELYTALRKSFPKQMHRKIGIISPYKEQVHELKKAFGKLRGYDIEISTIDGFQGREKDIVIFSCVRGPNQNRNRDDSASIKNIGFVKDMHRLNVAITRSKYALWIVGNAQTLSDGDLNWKNLIDHAKSKGDFIRRTTKPSSFFDRFLVQDRLKETRDRDQRGGWDNFVWDRFNRSIDYDGDECHGDVELNRYFQSERCKNGYNCKYSNGTDSQKQESAVHHIEQSENPKTDQQPSQVQKDFLREKFSRQGGGNFGYACSYCRKVVASAQISRWATHFRSCQEVPDADKTIYNSYEPAENCLKVPDADNTIQDSAHDNLSECHRNNLNESHDECGNHHLVGSDIRLDRDKDCTTSAHAPTTDTAIKGENNDLFKKTITISARIVPLLAANSRRHRIQNATTTRINRMDPFGDIEGVHRPVDPSITDVPFIIHGQTAASVELAAKAIEDIVKGNRITDVIKVLESQKKARKAKTASSTSAGVAALEKPSDDVDPVDLTEDADSDDEVTNKSMFALNSSDVSVSTHSHRKRSRSGSKEVGNAEKKCEDKHSDKDREVAGEDGNDIIINHAGKGKKNDRSRSNSVGSTGAVKSRNRSRSNSAISNGKSKNKSKSKSKENEVVGPPDFSCIVKNLPQKVEAAELTDYFIINGCASNNNPIKSEINISNTTGKSKGWAIVEFSCLRDQEKALGLNGQLWPDTNTNSRSNTVERKLVIVRR